MARQQKYLEKKTGAVYRGAGFLDRLALGSLRGDLLSLPGDDD